MEFNEKNELSTENIKACIKDFLDSNTSFDKLCKTDIYIISAAMEECLREQIDINRRLLSNQEGMYETNKILINRMNDALKELSKYNIISGNHDDYNDEIVYNAFCILRDGLNGKKDV